MPDPLVVQVMNQHKAALLRKEAQQMRQMAQRWLQVERALQSQVLRFTERVQQEGLTIGQIQSRQFQLERFSALLFQARREMDKYTDYAAPLIANRQQEMAATGIANASAAIEAVGEQNGVTIKFDRLPVEAVENMVGLAADGSPLRTLLRGSYGAGADGMFNRLIEGVALGKNPRVTARSMVRDGLSQSLNRMMVIARTEQLRVYRESSRETYRRSGVVEGYKRLAAHSRRTCAACLMADGQFYELDEPFEEHPAGRCTMLPVVKGLPPVTWQEGPEWFAEQPPDVQRDILGPGRFDAWQRGRFDLSQLVSRRTNPVWGDSLQPTSLRALLDGTAQPVTIRRTPTTTNTQPPQTTITAPVLPQRQPEITAPIARQRVKDIDGEYTERLAALGAQTSTLSFKMLSKPNDKRLQRQFNEATAEQQRLTDERDRRIRESLYVERPAQVGLSNLGADPITPSHWRRGMDEFNKLVSADVAPPIEARFIDTTDRRSNYHPGTKFLRMSATADEQSVVHELGHWLEDHNPELHRKVLEFYDRRTQGYALEWMGPGFDRDEITRKDKFLSPYMGKEYVENGDRFATEIVSMGLDHFYNQAAHLAKDDPDMFDFIFDLMRGR